MRKELAILMGLPGAGKTSFYRQCLAKTHVLVSKDLMKNSQKKSLTQEKTLARLMGQGLSIAVDNTHVTKETRTELISIGKAYGYQVVLYYFPMTVKESIARNQGQGRKVVPLVGIFSMAKALQLPDASESYDEMYEVKHVNERFFQIMKVDIEKEKSKKGGSQ